MNNTVNVNLFIPGQRKRPHYEASTHRKSVDPDSESADGYKPLSWPAWDGHQDIVIIPRMTDGVNAHQKNTDERAPIPLAAKSGHEAK
ncbi:hypothetical protein N7507_006016 [Penicillium longicatenatum]|nr:hypothetical protein N7507_006016 [Penicillium longicatenatum]